jgi:hypothetical protein
MSKKKIKNEVSVEIDKLTNSIENVITGEIFQTEFSKVTSKEIKKQDWSFDWHKELRDKNYEVFKMTTVENKNIIQGLVSLRTDDRFVSIGIVENAKFNRGKNKIYLGVGGNLFAYGCKISKDLGFNGFVGFVAKTSLIEYYSRTLGAEVALGQRMYIGEEASEKLINQYFKNK